MIISDSTETTTEPLYYLLMPFDNKINYVYLFFRLLHMSCSHLLTGCVVKVRLWYFGVLQVVIISNGSIPSIFLCM